MNATDILADLLLRADTNVAGAAIVTADEVSTWPDSTLADFCAAGILVQSQPENVVSCDACFNDHSEPIQFVDSPAAGSPRAYITCPEAGRVGVDLARLVRWGVDVRRLKGAITQATVSPEEVSRTSGTGAQTDFEHSIDYRWVKCRGREFELTEAAAEVTQVLDLARRANEPWLSWARISSQLQSPPTKMSQVFRGVRNWSELIERRRRDLYRLKV